MAIRYVNKDITSSTHSRFVGRGIYYAKYYGGGTGENGRWDKINKNQDLGGKILKSGKEKKRKIT